MSYEDGRIAKGEWAKGCLVSGSFDYGNGTVYNGGFVNNRREGKGILRKGDQIAYEGLWKADKPHQNGLMNNSLGSYKGGFLDGLRHNIGVQTYSNGFVYQGTWEADKVSIALALHRL